MSDFFGHTGFQASPGIGTLRETAENSFYWGEYALTRRQAVLDGAMRDSGNLDTTVLRPGLLLGMVYSTGEFKQWSPTATDGTQFIAGILDNPGVKMTDSWGNDRDRWRSVVIKGSLKPDRLLIGGQASFGITGNTYEYLIRAQLKKLGCIIYEEPTSTSMLASGDFLMGHTIIQAVTADRTLTNYESGSWFTNRGASGTVIFTLPASPKVGIWYTFSVVADQTITVAGAAGELVVAFNNATADSVGFATASGKIGGAYRVMFDGTSWLVLPHAWTTTLGTSQVGNTTTVTDA